MIEKKLMQEADLILTACATIKDLFLSEYQAIVGNKIACISHSADVEILQSARLKEKSRKFTIIFTGEFQKVYTRRPFEILKVIFERRLFKRTDIEVKIIGSIKRNMFLKKEIELLGLADVVKFVDYLSLKDYFSVLLSSDATLLPGRKNIIPIKLPDYLFTKKPIITFDPTDEMRQILKKSGLGIFVPNEIEDGVEVLLNLLRGNYKLNINEDYIGQFSAFNQTKKFADTLEKLIEKRE